MNIFILHKNPKKAARMLCDKHVGKMIIESAQMLCAAHWMNNSEAPYKQTHVNHPCTIWARTSKKNYEWLITYSEELCNEFKRRYKKDHKSCKIIRWCNKNRPRLKNKKRTPFVQAMPEKYKNKNPVKAYRNFYLNEKLKFCKWEHSKKPKFILNYEKNEKQKKR